MSRKVLFLDMDGVLTDFEGTASIRKLSILKASHTPNFYRDLPILGDAVAQVEKLHEYFDIHIASSPSWYNPYSFVEKMYWVEKHFPRIFNEKKVFLVPNKSLLIGDILIDDHPEWASAKDFKGKLIHFTGSWNDVWRQLKIFIE